MKRKSYKETTKLKVILDEVKNTLETDIRAKRRTRELVYARAVYYRLCKDLTSHSLSEIGSCLRKDHATVLHGLKVFEHLEFNKDYTYIKAYEEMYDRLKMNYFIKFNNSKEMKTKYYRYVNENINLREKNKHMKFFVSKQLKDVFETCREEFGFVPQTAYLKQRFSQINEMLKKIS
jgi:hypothetical protein